MNLAGTVDNGGIANSSVDCLVTMGGAGMGTSTAVFVGARDGSTDWYRHFAITGAGTLPVAGDIKLECFAPSVVNVQAWLTAVRVSSVS